MCPSLVPVSDGDCDCTERGAARPKLRAGFLLPARLRLFQTQAATSVLELCRRPGSLGPTLIHGLDKQAGQVGQVLFDACQKVQHWAQTHGNLRTALHSQLQVPLEVRPPGL